MKNMARKNLHYFDDEEEVFDWRIVTHLKKVE